MLVDVIFLSSFHIALLFTLTLAHYCVTKCTSMAEEFICNVNQKQTTHLRHNFYSIIPPREMSFHDFIHEFMIEMFTQIYCLKPSFAPPPAETRPRTPHETSR